MSSSKTKSWFPISLLIYDYIASTGVNYNESTALVITFVVNNHVDEAQNEKAKAWEKEFLNFMKNFSDPDMIIAYSAEVRISTKKISNLSNILLSLGFEGETL